MCSRTHWIKKPRTHFSLTPSMENSVRRISAFGVGTGEAGRRPRPKRFLSQVDSLSFSPGRQAFRRTAGSESALLSFSRNVNIRSAAASKQPVQWTAFWQIRMAAAALADPAAAWKEGRDACARRASERASADCSPTRRQAKETYRAHGNRACSASAPFFQAPPPQRCTQVYIASPEGVRPPAQVGRGHVAWQRGERERKGARESGAGPPARSIERAPARRQRGRLPIFPASFPHRIYCIERTVSGGRSVGLSFGGRPAAASLGGGRGGVGGVREALRQPRTVTAAAVLADGAAAEKSLPLRQLPVRRHSKNISPRDCREPRREGERQQL